MHSKVITSCQSCGFEELEDVLDLGFLPSVNDFQETKDTQREQLFFPTKLIKCKECSLVQLSCIVDKEILFPNTYPYTSSTTKVLRDNFEDLSKESRTLLGLRKDSLVCDVGSNDGNLLSFFADHTRVIGITPEKIGEIAISKGIPTIIDYFTERSCEKVINTFGKVDLVTATNVFAHIDEPRKVLKNIGNLLKKEGVFIAEVHYLKSLLETNQYDTVYHEHMRYYSLSSLAYLLNLENFKIFHAKLIPSHGGSLRIYSSKEDKHKETEQYKTIKLEEEKFFSEKIEIMSYREQVKSQRHHLVKLLSELKLGSNKIVAIGAPSRGTTLLNYCGINSSLITYICEIKGSHKIGMRLPGTSIPVLDESILFEDQPEYALLLSWHIADDLIKILKKKGLKSKFIIPLPMPKIIE